MKNYKLFLNIGLILLILVLFLNSTSKSYAQTDRDWSAPVNLSFSGVASKPAMVIDARGIIHTVWVDDIDGYKYAQSADGGVTWTQAVSVKFPFEPSGSLPTLLAGKSGVINVFWLSRDAVLFYAQTTSSDFGNPGNWIAISRLASNVLNFDVIIDSRDGLHLAYIRNTTSKDGKIPPGVYYRGTNVGGSWTEPTKLYESEYFRATKQSEAYIRVASSNSLPNQNIYVTWDNRAQKRVFMSVSKNSGTDWSGAQQIKGPEDTGGIDSPFNLSVAAFNKNVLLMWQVGEPESPICTLYSQWSKDDGNNWGDPVSVLGGRSECPLDAKFVLQTENYIAVLLNGEVSPSLLAWDGKKWSKAQVQTQLPSFMNPLTYDPILLGCRFDLINKDRLYVAGCDEGQGGDVWFLSRSLDSVENWFSPSLVWGEPVVLSVKAKTPERISNFYVAPDSSGNVHAVWAQSSVARENDSNMAIDYARWNGGQWTNPEPILNMTEGMPTQLLLTADSLDRLLLAWVDGHNGDLAFSWANIQKANLASEWEDISGLPSPSQLIDSSDMVVDGSGRIISAYAVPANENRGVYVVQSTDNGKDWSVPVRVFDAVSASWERIGHPHLSLETNGTLHLIFVRDTIRQGQPVGLYYSRSVDGGQTWSDAQIISEGEIEWADVVSYGNKTVHVIWQEYDGLAFANISQVSQDGGLSWGKQNNVTGVNEDATPVSLVSDGYGILHFVQLINKSNGEEYNQRNLVLQDWKWNGSDWKLELTKDFAIKGKDIKYSLSVTLTSTGYLSVFVPVEYNDPTQVNGFKSEVLAFDRFLGETRNSEHVTEPVVPTSVAETSELDAPILMSTPTLDFSTLYDDSVTTSSFQRNLAGLIVIIVGVVVTIILLMRRGSIKR